MAIWPFWPHRQLCPQGLYFWFCQRNSIASTNSNSLFSPQATPSFSFFFSTNRPIRSILPHTHTRTHTLTHTEATLSATLSLSHTHTLSLFLFVLLTHALSFCSVSLSPNRVAMKNQETGDEENNRWPPWLKALLGESFFEKCNLHRVCRLKSGCNRYCLDCMDGALCSISIKDHEDHRIVQVPFPLSEFKIFLFVAGSICLGKRGKT